MLGCKFGECEYEETNCCIICIKSEDCNHTCSKEKMKECQSLPDKNLKEYED